MLKPDTMPLNTKMKLVHPSTDHRHNKKALKKITDNGGSQITKNLAPKIR